MAEDQQKLQALSETLQKIQDDLQTTITARQTLESQSAENLAVQKEFSSSSSSSSSPQIYKLIGPILLKQERSEANAAVKGRLEYINKEIERTETKIRELQGEQDRKRGEVMGLQQRVMQAQQGQQQQPQKGVKSAG